MCCVVRHPKAGEAETKTYLKGLWREKVRWIWRLAIFDTVMLLAGLGYLYLGLKTPQVALYQPIGYMLCVAAIFMGIGIVFGYRCDKKSHAKKSAGLLKISRQ